MAYESKLKPVFYDANGLLGRGALFNQVYSDRSDGKTFNMKERGLRRFYKNGFSTVYMRRWKDELNVLTKREFLDEIFDKKPELKPKDKVLIDKYGIQMKRNNQYQYVFYFVPVTMASKWKSVINTVPVREIDFDEYVPVDGRYAPQEMMQILEFWNTCDRKRYVVKLLTAGNRIEASTPFLNFFNISLSIVKPGIRLYKDGEIAIQSYASETNRQIVEESRFMKIVKGTPYESYMLGGTLFDNCSKIDKVPESAIFWAGFKTEAGEGSIWRLNEDFFISDRINKSDIIITDKPYDIKQEQIVATDNNISSSFRNIYRRNKFHSTSSIVWNSFKPLLEISSIK